jgi:two-component system nitrogen regulation response regulator GlnG
MAPAQVVEVKDLPAEFKQVSYRVGITGSITGTNNNSLASINSPAALPGSAGPSGLPDQQSSSDFHRLETARSSSLPRGEDQSLGASMPEVTEQITAWEQGLVQEVQRSLAGQTAVPDDSRLMDDLTRRFESLVIRTALRYTRGRRIDAASRLGIGRNTITRKIQELKLEDDHW